MKTLIVRIMAITLGSAIITLIGNIVIEHRWFNTLDYVTLFIAFFIVFCTFPIIELIRSRRKPNVQNTDVTQ